MGRLPRLEPGEVDPEVQAIYDLYLKERGNIPNAFKTFAHIPSYLKTIIAHYREVMFGGTLPFKLKELVFLKVTRINGSRY